MSLKICSRALCSVPFTRSSIFFKTPLQSKIGVVANNHFQKSILPATQGVLVRHFSLSRPTDLSSDLFNFIKKIQRTQDQIDSFLIDRVDGEHLIEGYRLQIEIYLKTGGSPNVKDEEGNTLYDRAALTHDQKLIALLTKAGANRSIGYKLDHRDLFELMRDIIATKKHIDRNPADKFIKYSEHLLEGFMWRLEEHYLKPGGDPNNCDKDGNTLMHLAASANNLQLMKLLLKYKGIHPPKQQDRVGNFSSSAQARSDHLELVNELITSKKEADKHYSRKIAGGILYVDYLFEKFYYRLERLENTYLKLGGNPDSCDENGNTLLHLAASADNLDLIRLLLAYNADPLRKNNKGEIPSIPWNKL